MIIGILGGKQKTPMGVGEAAIGAPNVAGRGIVKKYGTEVLWGKKYLGSKQKRKGLGGDDTYLIMKGVQKKNEEMVKGG